jgi:gliding motility-associated-like protein
MDTVVVRSDMVDTTLKLLGKAMYCLGNGDSAVLRVNPCDSIQWFKDGVAIFGANKTDYKVNISGTYRALLFNSTGCSMNTSSQPIVIDKAKPGIRYPIQYAVIDIPVSLRARQFGSNILWSPATSLNNAASYTPVFSGVNEQFYQIRISTNTGCVTVDTQVVKTVKNAEIYVPTAFTPNDDLLNDLLRPTLMGIKELHYFRVFNRWGQLLYEMRGEMPGWDGKLSGVKQGSQVVVWMAEALGVDGRVHVRKGTSALIR